MIKMLLRNIRPGKTRFSFDRFIAGPGFWKLIIVVSFLLPPPASADAQVSGTGQQWQHLSILTVKDLCDAYPLRIQNLFQALDLERSGLEGVKAAVLKKDWAGACNELIAYYKKGETAPWLRTGKVAATLKHDEQGDAVLANTFTFQGVTSKQPALGNGQLDWKNKGPNNDVEWAYFLNRHIFYSPLSAAYRSTGNEVYTRCFSNLIADWIISNPLPEGGKEESTATWRVLEAGLRVGYVWPQAFYGFQQAEGFSPAARILMLSSLPEHAAYILHYHLRGHNHAAMELNGLSQIALCWPEFKEAGKWYDHALDKMMEELDLEVYPDGVQKELTNHYHNVALDNFEAFKDNSEKAKKKMPEKFIRTIERMYNYDAYALRPDGYGLLNNDADLINERKRLARAAVKLNRGEWQYIATNGKEGTVPGAGPSVFFPWAGHMLMRNGWTDGAQWSFFDVGPWGLSHQHNDKLHFSLFANGQNLLVDGGRYWYKKDIWGTYFNTTASHNVILIDGKGQNQEPPGIVSQPLAVIRSIQPEFDFCMATFEGGFGDKWRYSTPAQYNRSTDSVPGKHTRAVVYIKNKFWIIVDAIDIDRPRTITPLWHFDPSCEVSLEGTSIVTTNAGRGNLRITPVSGLDWSVSTVRGQEQPQIQGWYSPAYNSKVPNVCALYNARIEQSAVFAWVLVPGIGKIPAVKTELLPSPAGSIRIKIYLPNEPSQEIAVRLNGDKPVALSNGYVLEGICAIMSEGKRALVAQGQIKDRAGQVVVQSSATSENP